MKQDTIAEKQFESLLITISVMIVLSAFISFIQVI